MDLMKPENPIKARGKPELRSWLPIILSTSVTLIGVGYLLAVVFGKIGANRFGTTEAIIFLAILLLNSSLIQRIGRFAISGKGVEFQVREVQEEQVRQRAEIKSLKFLVSYFVTEQELEHLQRLAGKIPAAYSNPDDWHHGVFSTELRRLRSLGLIRMQSGKFIGAMPKVGDLSKYCRITDRGQEYLKLRDEVESQELEGG
jgi:hypothetical protein